MARRRYPKKKKLPEEAVKVTIESLAHDGRGVAHVDGKVIFIDEALPGEEVEFIYTDSRKDYAEGRVETLLSRSDDRSEPECEHFGQCGGCSFQHVKNEQQIHIKQGLLQEQFQRIGKLTIEEFWPPLEGPYFGYRQKARMGVKYVAKKGRVLVGFRERRNPFLAEIESCKVMHPIVGENLMNLSAMIGQLSIKDKIPQIEVAIGDDACVLAFRVLEPATDEDKEIMRRFGHEYKMSICLQSKGPDTIKPIDGEPEIPLTYSLPEQGVHFKFKPAMFTQVNYEINRKMITRVMQEMDFNEQDTVLDLFCGLGNFTLPIATKAGSVIGVEGDQPLVNHAKENAALNNLSNVEFYAADLSKDVTDLPWAKKKFNKVVIDPSRAGAAEVLPNLKKWNPDQIMYISCNPSTLARDAGILVNDMGYTLVKAGVMDMFPQTGHVESIALFKK